MENYQVSARKYRPATFDTVVGQKALTATLRNAIAIGKLAHAYLFCGSRGVGKTSCARIFAKTINCQNPDPSGNPCNCCPSCEAFNQGRSLNIVELDAASNNSVDNIRELIDQVRIPPTEGKYRVFIIDEVHMLSPAAFNAFLKTLEEPPEYVIFILATTEKQKILPTILSRCQIYDFNRITIADIVSHLEYVAKSEGIAAERSALSVIAEKADGAMRDALSIFDQVAACSRGNITYQSAIDSLNVLDRSYYSRLFSHIRKEDIPSALLVFKQVRDNGFDTHFFINGLAKYVRTLMLASSPQTLTMIDAEDSVRKQFADEAAQFSPEFFYAAMSLVNDADLNYRLASDKTFLAELLIIRLCQQLSPSPVSDGAEEGQLKPIAVKAPSGTAAAGKPDAAPENIPQAAQPESAAAGVLTGNVAQTAHPGGSVSGQRSYGPAPAAPSSRTMFRRTPAGPSLRQIYETAEEKTAEKVTLKRENPYTDADVTAAWERFIDNHPSEIILLTAMKKTQPARTDGDIFEITIDNHVQEAEINNRLAELYSEIRDALQNDNWQLKVNVDSGEGSPETWNDREVLAHALENNPAFRRLYDMFKLKL